MQQQQQQFKRDNVWIKGVAPNTTYHVGSVGINVEIPDEALCVHGNIRYLSMCPIEAELK